MVPGRKDYGWCLKPQHKKGGDPCPEMQPCHPAPLQEQLSAARHVPKCTWGFIAQAATTAASNPCSLGMGGEKRCAGSDMNFWVRGVFAKLGKSRGSVCAANFGRFNIADCTAAARPWFVSSGDLFFGGGFSYR